MSLPSFATQTVTVWRAPLIDDHGSQVRDWANAVSHEVAGCSVQPGGGSIDWTNQTAITTVYTVFAEPGSDVLDTDRVELHGVVYQLDGPVKVWATGVLDHMEIPLKEVSG